MARAYAMSPTLEQIEDAMVAALAADDVVAAYAPAITSFHGSLEDAITQAAIRTPAFLVVNTSCEAEPEGMENDLIRETFQVLCLARNLRSRAAQRNAAASGEVGVYQMRRDAIEILVREDFDLDGCQPLVFVSGELLSSGTTEGGRDRTLSIYKLTFEATSELRPVEPTEALANVVLTLVQQDAPDPFTVDEIDIPLEEEP